MPLKDDGDNSRHITDTQGGGTQQVTRARGQQQTGEETLQDRTQPSAEASATVQTTDELQPIGSSLEPSYRPTERTNTLLRQVEEAVEKQKLSSGGREWLTSQIARWESQKWLKETIDRLKESPCYSENELPAEDRRITRLKELIDYTSSYIDGTQSSLNDQTISHHLRVSGKKMDAHLKEIEKLSPVASTAATRIQSLENNRKEFLQSEINPSQENIKNIKDSIQKNPANTSLRLRHKRAQNTLAMMKLDLEFLQTPWPGPQPNVSTRHEQPPVLPTKLESQKNPSNER